MKKRKDIIDMTGKRFGLLTALRRGTASPGRVGTTAWVCRCDCGREKTICGRALRSGASKSCGCKRKRARKDVSGLICVAPGCDKPQRYSRNGHCGAHYDRLRKYGSYDLPARDHRCSDATREKARLAARARKKAEGVRHCHEAGRSLGTQCAYLLSMPMREISV